jgi:hypothetical protein
MISESRDLPESGHTIDTRVERSADGRPETACRSADILVDGGPSVTGPLTDYLAGRNFRFAAAWTEPSPWTPRSSLRVGSDPGRHDAGNRPFRSVAGWDGSGPRTSAPPETTDHIVGSDFQRGRLSGKPFEPRIAGRIRHPPTPALGGSLSPRNATTTRVGASTGPPGS